MTGVLAHQIFGVYCTPSVTGVLAHHRCASDLVCTAHHCFYSVSQQLAGREKVIQSKDEQIQRKEGENRSKDDKIQQLQRSLDTRMEQIQALQILRHSELIQSQETGIVKLEQQREVRCTVPLAHSLASLCFQPT